ncbi:helix-turn-helix domain-containing protein [Falsiroseomonas selenitidurans]|uniref:Helix-turn-helix transcriptional regulator n=1 Tax=Falsiroseomonas selenitidurans TaxID=2716335 RepID=A0ABX1EFW4_9PROT|nr:XRE family transcriptional regulator [Falsiroseomonas selenitidurans]NKC33790.1 helix-turn-helix transcriptional regulator [Falsiroseomonas selenitidurans]
MEDENPAPDPAGDPAGARLAACLKAERESRGWSIAELASRSAVSRAMISKVERVEASPTAALLGRLCGALGLTLSALLARAEGLEPVSLSRAAAQPRWRDPGTGYVRRAVSPPGAEPELVLVELPPGARVDFPAESYAPTRGHAIWVMQGELHFHEGGATHCLGPGDCLSLGPPRPTAYENRSAAMVTYLVALSRR